MALATVGAIALLGLDPRPVRVECSFTPGLPTTRFTGLPDAVVREAADRVKGAVQRSDITWPEGRVVVNLAPAGLPKSGTGFDLAIALAAVSAAGHLEPEALRNVWAFGELGLDGSTHAVPGALPVAQAVRRFGGGALLVPDRAAAEAALIDGVSVVPVANLSEAIAVVKGDAQPRSAAAAPVSADDTPPDLLDVRGQHLGRRALEIAAAGGHHVLLAGPPGCGKSMLAQRLIGILPTLDVPEALEVASIHSIAGARSPEEPLSRRPPFRDPHHTTSVAGLVGGGSGIPRPGELSLAHRGVLFLDELLEVPRWVSDALRQPLETGYVTIVRARATVRYPGRVLLVAATNPCPCGHLGSGRRACTCRPHDILRYRSRLSGPLLDRLDLQVELNAVDRDRLTGAPDGEPTAAVAARVLRARDLAAGRWGGPVMNRDADTEALRATATPAVLAALGRAIESMGLSARAFDRSLRVARTIADLDGREVITSDDADEAVGYRLRDAAAAA